MKSSRFTELRHHITHASGPARTVFAIAFMVILVIAVYQYGQHTIYLDIDYHLLAAVHHVIARALFSSLVV